MQNQGIKINGLYRRGTRDESNFTIDEGSHVSPTNEDQRLQQ
jgi:hypothetical protein